MTKKYLTYLSMALASAKYLIVILAILILMIMKESVIGLRDFNYFEIGLCLVAILFTYISYAKNLKILLLLSIIIFGFVFCFDTFMLINDGSAILVPELENVIFLLLPMIINIYNYITNDN
jgi:hypothetical protein